MGENISGMLQSVYVSGEAAPETGEDDAGENPERDYDLLGGKRASRLRRKAMAEGGVGLTADHGMAVKEAAELMDDMAGDEKVSRAYRGACKLHGGELKGVCSVLEKMLATVETKAEGEPDGDEAEEVVEEAAKVEHAEPDGDEEEADEDEAEALKAFAKLDQKFAKIERELRVGVLGKVK
jgi:hypothetical protein